jgi:hypothetical protein
VLVAQGPGRFLGSRCCCSKCGVHSVLVLLLLLLRLCTAAWQSTHMCWCVIHPTLFLGCPCSKHAMYAYVRVCSTHGSAQNAPRPFFVRLHSGPSV